MNLTGINFDLQQTKEKADISFYRVPFVCNAAPSIGCGSRSKPVLFALEKSDVISEAWLNREGNVIAVVWTVESSLKAREAAIVSVFKEKKVNASKLMMDDFATNLDSFSSKNEWYRGDDVDALSKEEAGIIADQLMQAIIVKTNLKESDQEIFKNEIQDIFYEFFLNFESLDQLADSNVYKDKLEAIIKLGEQYVGVGNMPSLDELWEVCSGGTGSCEHESCKSSCEAGT